MAAGNGSERGGVIGVAQNPDLFLPPANDQPTRHLRRSLPGMIDVHPAVLSGSGNFSANGESANLIEAVWRCTEKQKGPGDTERSFGGGEATGWLIAC